MEQNNATMDATITEYLCPIDNTYESIDGAAKITHIQNGTGLWHVDDSEELDEDPDAYRAECGCGAEFGTWGRASDHVEAEH